MSNIFDNLFKKTREQRLSAIFNRFVGAEMGIYEHTYDTGMGMEGRSGEHTVRKVYKDDPTFQAMQKVAKDNGVILGISSTCNIWDKKYVKNRVRAHFEEGNDGKYRIKHFDIG